ncbi:hypothetical protein DM01DRAFT_1332693 [Hesseltinella vesiculosa]|uniref:GDP/GTP exchange factor Sec2 N-terminal domain-containing protein n=1 Tax=Hesseltinella vesiculosa TaxID=101127 RepID=A0A1X2GU58_9FUNG|nr:hypothetical protein DM01DRAFT_1332693 [Hesseltinella vesiculosa]
MTSPLASRDDVLLLRCELGYVRDQVLKKDQQLQQQQMDMEQLNQKYVAALDQVANIQHEKDMAEKELEELSVRLFEQANAMVAQERRHVCQLQTHNDQLQQELIGIRLPTSTDNAKMRTHHASWSPPSPPTPSSTSLVWTRPWLLAADFDHFAQALRQAQEPLDTLLMQHKHLPFMKQCLMSDVEPCLTLGQNGRWMKKMTETLMKRPYTPEPITLEELRQRQTNITLTPPRSTSSMPPSPSRWQQRVLDFIDDHRPRWHDQGYALPPSPTPSALAGLTCAGCGRPLLADQHHYRWKWEIGKLALLYGLDEDWLVLDASCCERLRAVGSFFHFLRQLVCASSSSLPIDLLASRSPLYVEMLQLRMAMVYARLGLGSSATTQIQLPPSADHARRVSCQQF